MSWLVLVSSKCGIMSIRHLVASMLIKRCLKGGIRYTPDRRQSKMLIYYRRKLETEVLIDICGPTGDKWQSKTLLLAIFICVR